MSNIRRYNEELWFILHHAKRVRNVLFDADAGKGCTNKELLEAGANLIREEPGPAHRYYKKRTFKKMFDKLLQTNERGWAPL